jgi:WD40 repeat protein
MIVNDLFMMKSGLQFPGIVLMLFLAVLCKAQPVAPVLEFRDSPRTHNMHLASDGVSLFTCNGGTAELGQISKFSPDGVKEAVYPLALDMRSLMWNAADLKLYVYTYERQLFRIDDLKEGKYTEIYRFPERHSQSVPALSPDGGYLYFMESGTVYVYSMKDGKLTKTMQGFKAGDSASEGGTSIAAGKKRLFTWDASAKTVYVYNLKGKLLKSAILQSGDYGFSLSAAHDLIWVSGDGNFEEGTWYGYRIK